ncbi:MAG: TolC family protein [Bacteroidales bacterium]|nr:TolC family protein [Bacteroidales bacterium]
MQSFFQNIVILILLSSTAFSQFTQDEQLHEYIRTGLENNLNLKQREADWLQASLRLGQAKGMFYPDLSLNARYTVADGGRIISFPVGDLLNPVYSTLNMLTSSSNFPEIENEQFPFFRPKEHETKLRLVQPLLNTDIFYNKQIRQNDLDIRFADMASYRRSLVFEIKQAYYNYLKAVELLNLLENTRPVLEENLRVNKSQYGNDKVTADVLMRSESEILKLNESIASANASVQVSIAYFNFLLNRDLEEPILSSLPELPLVPADVEEYTQRALESREEITRLEHYSELAGNNLGMNKASKFPDVFAVVDYGYQGEDYRFTSDDDFVMASIVLKWDLFKGFQERSKISEARIMEEKVDLQLQEAENLIRLEVLNTWYELISAQKKLDASRAYAVTASEIFRMIQKKYGQDQTSLLEFLDARNNMTMAGQEAIINTWDLMIRWAAFERAIGMYDIKKN